MQYIRGHNNRGREIKRVRWIAEDRGYETPCWIWQLGKTSSGYARLKRDGRQLCAHRVVFEAMHGPLPTGAEVDHICRVRECVNPEHLRLATHAQNQQNLTPRVGASSLYRGVCWNQRRQKWLAYGKVAGRARYLGQFDDEDEAGIAAEQFRRESMPFSRD